MNEPPASSVVLILFGGDSEERRVSVASAQHVGERLPEATLVFESVEGPLYVCPRAHVLAHEDPFTTDYAPPAGTLPVWPSLSAAAAAAASDPALAGAAFFFAYHGRGGEDGTAARLFEARGLAFTGSGSQASADAFDKEVAKRKARAAGVRTAPSLDLPRGRAAIEEALVRFMSLHPRAVAKPVRGGSSVGLHHVGPSADLAAVAGAIDASGVDYLAEAFVAGRELTVGVVEGPLGLRALPPSEVCVDPGRAFDYDGKYLGKGTREITPADVGPGVTLAAQSLALTMHAALGCRGYSRTDVIITPDGPVFLELNTLPGLTRASFLPQQLAAEGTSVESFLRGQLDLARARARGSPKPERG